jgi:hypothetical protein
LTPRTSGVPGHRVKPASGSEEWDFQFPTNPAMLVGWDTDGDGAYPPFDPDDTAVMHGDPDEVLNNNGTTRAFRMNDSFDNDYFEMAHFTVKDYGRDDTSPNDAGFMKLNTARSVSHLYLHDLRLLNINRDQQPASARSTFNWFAISDYQYLASPSPTTSTWRSSTSRRSTTAATSTAALAPTTAPRRRARFASRTSPTPVTRATSTTARATSVRTPIKPSSASPRSGAGSRTSSGSTATGTPT